MHYFRPEKNAFHEYIWPALVKYLQGRSGRLLDLGCGGGSTAGMLADRGWDVVGIEPCAQAVQMAQSAFPKCRFYVGSAYDDLSVHGTFDAVISMEVVEHLYSPASWARTIAGRLKPDGLLVVSTPYHGYLKNLAVTLMGHWDQHHSPLYEGGHIKFWSRATLTRLLADSGLRVRSFQGAGRLPYLWKSMVLTATRSNVSD
jgi:2-polyprenyl-6-hydroxyphenyl methylase/3-demethylubiquinone-9 3-methyltransferase